MNDSTLPRTHCPTRHCMVLATFANQTQAQEAIDFVLHHTLAACAQSLNIHSQYIWLGERCHKDEVLVLFKTTYALYNKLEAAIQSNHSYEVPEIIALDIEKGLESYLAWITQVTTSS